MQIFKTSLSPERKNQFLWFSFTNEKLCSCHCQLSKRPCFSYPFISAVAFMQASGQLRAELGTGGTQCWAHDQLLPDGRNKLAGIKISASESCWETFAEDALVPSPWQPWGSGASSRYCQGYCSSVLSCLPTCQPAQHPRHCRHWRFTVAM